MMPKLRFHLIIILMMLISVIAAGCSQQPKTDHKPANIPSVTSKGMVWEAYQKVFQDLQGRNLLVDPFKAKELLSGNESKYIIVDMREAEDYAKGHIKGAVNLTAVQLADNLDKLPAGKTFLLYCYTGQNSGLAIVPLRAYGFSAFLVSTNFSSLEKAGFEMDTVPVNFKPAEVKQTADPKAAAALASIKENYRLIAKQAGDKALILKSSEIKSLADSAPDKYVYVDLRAAGDYDKAHVKGAVSAPLPDLQSKAASLPKDKILLLYCYSGQTSAMATAPLTAEGFKMISVFNGFPGVEEGGLPIEKK